MASIGAVCGAVCGRDIPQDGGKLPEGVKLVGRWFGTNGKGCLVVEASEPKKVFEAVTEYAEFMQIEATPAIEDQEAGEVLGKLFG